MSRAKKQPLCIRVKPLVIGAGTVEGHAQRVGATTEKRSETEVQYSAGQHTGHCTQPQGGQNTDLEEGERVHQREEGARRKDDGRFGDGETSPSPLPSPLPSSSPSPSP